MNANASRPVVRNDRPSRMSSPASSASCAAVRTCAVGGRIEATVRWSSLSETPGLRRHEREVDLVALVEQRLRGGEVEHDDRRAAEAGRLAEGDGPDELERLLRTAGRDRHGVADLVVLLVGRRDVHGDLVRPARLVPLPDPERGERLRHPGGRDRRRAAGRDDLAVLAHDGGDVVDLARDLADLGQLRGSRRAPGSSSGRGIVKSVSTCSRPETTTSAPLVPDAKISSNAFWIVSVRTNVPAIIVTPRRTAMTVSEVRSLRAASPRSARRVTPAPSSGRGSARRRGGARRPRCGRRRGRSRGRRPRPRWRRG